MKKVTFAFGIHNHQPIGNFDFVFEEAYQKSYLPFLEILKKHPGVRIAIHFTGILLDWIEANHPELLAIVREMTGKGQLEVLTGAYYEPILTVIPEADRIGQIKKLSERVEQLFNYSPTGMWLAERIWEPTLPATLHDAGVKYTIIDDTHFKYAGLTEKDLNGYFLTEDLGKSVALFPISKHLRYTIPFQAPEETLKHLKKYAADDQQSVIVFADDGEKFGVWPDTFRHVYENGWLDRFFSAIEDNLDWIEMKHFAEIVPHIKPKHKIYLPTASYAEMMHWSLFPPTYRQYETFEHLLDEQSLLEEYGLFVRGGFWRNFMAKYPEINNMHKKMLRISNKLWRAPESLRKKAAAAFDQLWAGQCNCPYWHGVFGGMYLSHLRQAIYKSLITAEKIFDESNGIEYPPLEISDFDVDGHDEVLVERKLHNAYFRPDYGAVMFEYDYKPAAKNILDTITRREEGYHDKLKHAKLAGEQDTSDSDETASIHDLVLTKEPDLDKQLAFDWYEKKSFIDHFLGGDVRINDFKRAQFTEDGDFVNQPYHLTGHTYEKKRLMLNFRREGNIWLAGKQQPLTVEKVIMVADDAGEVRAGYKLKNNSGNPLKLRFAVEFNFGLQAGHADDRYYYDDNGKLSDFYLDSTGSLTNRNSIGLRDEYLKIDIKLKSAKPAEIWRLPVETISLSEAGFERVYQSSTVLFIWEIELTDEWETDIAHIVSTAE